MKEIVLGTWSWGAGGLYFAAKCTKKRKVNLCMSKIFPNFAAKLRMTMMF